MDMIAVGKRLKAARTDAGLSLRELAAKVGLNHQTVKNIEDGCTTTTETLARVAAALGLPVEITLGEDPSAVVPSDRRPVLDRFAAVLPHIPTDELDVFVHELALWEKRYRPRE